MLAQDTDEPAPFLFMKKTYQFWYQLVWLTQRLKSVKTTHMLSKQTIQRTEESCELVFIP